MTGKKKGLSIGAAMKQRMDSQEEGGGPEPVRPPEKEAAQAPTPPAAPDETEALESFNTRLPHGLHRRLKVHTAAGGHKIQDVVAQALGEYLERADKKER